MDQVWGLHCSTSPHYEVAKYCLGKQEMHFQLPTEGGNDKHFHLNYTASG